MIKCEVPFDTHAIVGRGRVDDMWVYKRDTEKGWGGARGVVRFCLTHFASLHGATFAMVRDHAHAPCLEWKQCEFHSTIAMHSTPKTLHIQTQLNMKNSISSSIFRAYLVYIQIQLWCKKSSPASSHPRCTISGCLQRCKLLYCIIWHGVDAAAVHSQCIRLIYKCETVDTVHINCYHPPTWEFWVKL